VSTRIGVAIAVPAPHADVLQRHRASFGDPLAWAIPPHVTLVPPMSLPDADAGPARALLEDAAARAAPFDIALCGTGTFRPVSPVVFVPLVTGAPECAAIEARVRTGVLEGVRRFPFHPHVTVAHEIDDDALDRAASSLADFSADFRVEHFTLYRQEDDGVWQPAEEFPLG
jgi:2'-5' RNA ligase